MKEAHSVKPQPGGILNILFRAAGPNPEIPTLQAKLSGSLDGTPINIGDIRYGEKSESAFISLAIVEACDDKIIALANLLTWLNQHAKVLEHFEADKWIEVNTYLLPDQAYEQIAFSPELMRAAIKADCHLDNTCYALITPRDSMHRRTIKTFDAEKNG
jgi:hypothetical protein